MLNVEGWLPQAQALAVGKRARVSHDCGPGSCMIVSNNLDSFKAWCFRCCEAGYVAKVPTLADQVEIRKTRAAEQELSSAVLPLPTNYDIDSWPIQAKVWLYKGGLSKPRIEALGIYYHEPTKRVVIPIVEGEELTYWQARAVMPDQQPKYINPSIDRAKVLPSFGSGPVIVLTEDYLSAVQVGRVTEAWSLLGVDLKAPILAKLLDDGRPVACWLDPDKAGIEGNQRISKELRSLGVEVSIIESSKDPKLLSKQETLQCLSQSYPCFSSGQ